MQNIRPNTATTENGFFSDVFSGIFKSIGLESGGYDSFVQLLFSWLTLYVLSVFVYARLSLCLLYTSPSPRDRQKSRMPSSA